jgi:hypothetical protein
VLGFNLVKKDMKLIGKDCSTLRRFQCLKANVDISVALFLASFTQLDSLGNFLPYVPRFLPVLLDRSWVAGA